MIADVMNREMLIAACLALIDQVATEHPAGHQGKLAARYIIRSSSGERVGLMFVQVVNQGLRLGLQMSEFHDG